MTEPRARGTTWDAKDADVVGDMRRWIESERQKVLLRQPTVLPRSLLGYYAKQVILDEAAAVGIDAVIEDPPPVFHRGGASVRGSASAPRPALDMTMINKAQREWEREH